MRALGPSCIEAVKPDICDLKAQGRLALSDPWPICDMYRNFGRCAVFQAARLTAAPLGTPGPWRQVAEL
jgi:hypothetical protein